MAEEDRILLGALAITDETTPEYRLSQKLSTIWDAVSDLNLNLEPFKKKQIEDKNKEMSDKLEAARVAKAAAEGKCTEAVEELRGLKKVKSKMPRPPPQ